jgi:hypothetical protein
MSDDSEAESTGGADAGAGASAPVAADCEYGRDGVCRASADAAMAAWAAAPAVSGDGGEVDSKDSADADAAGGAAGTPAAGSARNIARGEQNPNVLAGGTIRIKVYDDLGKVIPNAPFEFSAEGSAPVTGQTADSEGIITLADVQVPTRAELKWGFPGQPPLMSFTLTLFLDDNEELDEKASRKRLNHLGYIADEDDPSSYVAAFQQDFGHLANPELTANGELDSATMKLIKSLHDTAPDDLRNSQAKQT